MVPFMPGKRLTDKQRAFFVIFSTMVGAVEIARMLPEGAQEKVLETTRDFSLAELLTRSSNRKHKDSSHGLVLS